MQRTLRVSTTALALGLLGLACSAPPGGAERAPAVHRPAAIPLGGVNVRGPDVGATLAQADRAVREAHALHAKVVRAEVPWSILEPTGSGQIDPRALAFTDRLVSDAASAGIRVIMVVDSTPCWASSAPTSLLRKCGQGQSNQASSWPPSDPATFASFVGYLARRYNGNLAAIEVWNEPDHANENYFAGPHKAERYAAILKAAYTAIKQASPQVPVLGGSIVGANGVFLRALYAAGIKGYYDGLAVHFYTLTLASLRAIHQVQVANGDSKPLWLDEFGWSSCWPAHRTQQEQACVTARTQAANLANVFESLANTPYVAAVVPFKLQDSRGLDFGALTAGDAHKPAFGALVRVLSSPLGRVSPVTLSLHRRNGRVRATGSGPVGDFMQLEAFRGSVLRYRAVFTLDRFNRYSIELPRVLGTHGLRVRVYQYWTGVGGAAQRSI
jgi:hypothetical protein